MRTFLDVHRLVDTLVDHRRDRIRAVSAVVDVEDGLRCPPGVCEETVSAVFGSLLDHLLDTAGSSHRHVRIGWLPTSEASRVFFLTNSGRAENGARPREASLGAADPSVRGSLAEARLRVEAEGGRLWAEENPEGGSTFFVLFGSPTPPDGTAGPA